MASITKRGKYYYIKFSKTVGGQTAETKKSLGIKLKEEAKEALQILELLEERGEINPYHKSFNPQEVLIEWNREQEPLQINTLREAADYYYQKKSYLSNGTIKNAENRTMDKCGAYEQAIEHFMGKNNIADLPPKLVKQHHFENIIFKPGIKPATRSFYFRMLRIWWNALLEWEVVSKNYFPVMAKSLPKIRENIRPKMLTENELNLLFNKWDEELQRKKNITEYDETKTQWWFKPLIAVYFYCGLRKHEAAYTKDLKYSGLKGENLYFIDGRLEMIYLPPTKGPKERSIPIPEPCRILIEQYLGRRGKPRRDEYLFIYMGGRRKGCPVTGARAYRQFKHYIKLCDDVPNSRTLHGMRHERITTWLEKGYNASEAQFMAGHSSLRQTEKYTHLKGLNLLRKQRDLEREIENNS